MIRFQGYQGLTLFFRVRKKTSKFQGFLETFQGKEKFHGFSRVSRFLRTSSQHAVINCLFRAKC